MFDKLARRLIRSILLPVPTARTKGVLVAPTVYGNVLVGPTAEDVADRGDTATTAAGLGSLVAAGRRILPGLAAEEVTSTYAGLRAATGHPDYQIRVDAERRYACAGGIRSTGLSASLGIAEHVVGQLGEAGLALRPRACGPVPVMPYLGEAGVRPYQDAERIAVHAAETADIAALSGQHAARQIAAALGGAGFGAWPPGAGRVPVRVEPPLRWISPNAIGPSAAPPLGRFVLRSQEFVGRVRLEVRQDNRLLARSRPLRLVPGRPVHLGTAWQDLLDPQGGPVRVTTASRRDGREEPAAFTL